MNSTCSSIPAFLGSNYGNISSSTSCSISCSTCGVTPTSTLHTQPLWYRAEYSFLAFFTSLTSHTYRLWSLYTQVRCLAAGSKVRASVSGYREPGLAGSRLLWNRVSNEESSAVVTVHIWSTFWASFAVFVPVLPALSEVNSQAVRPVQRGDILQVGRAEHSDDAVSAAAINETLTDRQTARRRCL